jgi:hypothetical protein
MDHDFQTKIDFRLETFSSSTLQGYYKEPLTLALGAGANAEAEATRARVAAAVNFMVIDCLGARMRYRHRSSVLRLYVYDFRTQTFLDAK